MKARIGALGPLVFTYKRKGKKAQVLRFVGVKDPLNNNGGNRQRGSCREVYLKSTWEQGPTNSGWEENVYVVTATAADLLLVERVECAVDQGGNKAEPVRN